MNESNIDAQTFSNNNSLSHSHSQKILQKTQENITEINQNM